MTFVGDAPSTIVSFADLASGFSDSGLPGRDHEAFGVSRRPDLYIAPRFSKRVHAQVGAQVTLISARGATGKTHFAHYLSGTCGFPIWTLQKDKAVGATSLGMHLAEYLGSHNVADILRQQERPTVIIDSLDEARSRVSQTSWNDFVESLVGYENLNLILLGRERTLEDLWVALDDKSVELQWFEVAPFDTPGQVDYVDMSVERKMGEGAAASSPYVDSRDAVLNALRSAIGGDDETFMGYAPVLDAVAALLTNANYAKILSKYGSGAQATSRLDVLMTILDDLLERERKKLDPLAQDLKLSESRVYSAAEQIDWLLHFLEGAPEPSLLYIADVEVRRQYREGALEFAPMHPFRSEGGWASQVFAAYVAASKFDDWPARPARLDRIGRSSGLLFDLISAKSAGQATLDEWKFGALHHSVLASEGTGTEISASVLVGEDGFASVVVARAEGGISRQVDGVLVPERQEELQVRGATGFLSIETPYDVAFADDAGSLLLGPDLFVSARRVRVHGSDIAVASMARATSSQGGEALEPSVVLEVSEDLVADGTLRFVSPDDIHVYSQAKLNLAYPWPLVTHDVGPQEAAEHADRAVRFLNMFMNLTRNHGHKGERGVFKKKLEGRQSVKRDTFEAAVGVLKDKGVAWDNDTMLYMRAEWEDRRFSGKTLPGQRTLADPEVSAAWRDVLTALRGVM